jgi:indole-3-glycerol phosphate synthase
MEVDIKNSIKLKEYIDEDKIIVSESGLKVNQDLVFLKQNGINNFLIGESLMIQKDLTNATKKILGITN